MPMQTKQNQFERNEFPTAWQKVVFRNYRMVPSENIADVLGCSAGQVEEEAVRMGLRQGKADPEWLSRGYITIIRNNWDLLPDNQICALIGFSRERLDFVLEKEDFLRVKLGTKNPECTEIHYAPLTEAEREATEKLAVTVAGYDVSERKMFDFFTDTADTKPEYIASEEGGIRLVHGFLTPCGDTFIEDSRKHLPDILLDSYAKQGINALFLHGVLSTLSPYCFDPEMSKDYPIRRKNLKELIKRAALRGIKIYLYFNEPRALPKNVYESYGKPEIGGRMTNRYVHLCLSKEAGQEYLYTATRDLFEEIPEIGGIFNITMSENPTHCRSSWANDCPHCAALTESELPVRVNNIMHKAIRDAGSAAEVINYAWGWNWSAEEMDRAMAALHPEIAVMQVSENAKQIEKGGVTVDVNDYSISNPGSSEKSEKLLRTAAKYGHKLYAKVQINCSWECACVPYLPLFDIQIEHLRNLQEIGVKDVMLTWTLGGYPSIAYDAVADYLASPEEFSMEKWYSKQFGENGEKIHRAVKLFCEGFREYPFSIGTAYYSPKNMGAANLWSLTPDKKGSAMVGYSTDHYEDWTAPYPIEVYLSQFGKMLTAWDEACDMLDDVVQDEKTAERALFARFAALQIHADVIHTRYAAAKRELPGSKQEMLQLLEAEREIIVKQLALMEKSSLIGYETSNHYFFTERNFIEKMFQIENLHTELQQM